MKEKIVSALDVAKYILEKWEKGGEILTAMKLQKLVYYSQAWFLSWNKKPLFKEKVFSWVGGPVIRELYDEHKGQFYVYSVSKGSEEELSNNQKDIVNRIISSYGKKSAEWLSQLTHLEDPWKVARKTLKPLERGNCEITTESMRDYYSSIDGEPV